MLVRFCVLACAITWALDGLFVAACLRGGPPSPAAMLLVGLGAFGPAAAALVVGSPDENRFGAWRMQLAGVRWIVLALAAVPVVNLCATAVYALVFGAPARWFHPPLGPEHWVAMVFFSVGEELGWRGFAHPRFASRFGPALGSLLLGLVWGVWHLGMSFAPDGTFPLWSFAREVVELAFWSVVVGWLFERSDRRMPVAIAAHASGHLDNLHHDPDLDPRFIAIRLALIVLVAGLAARDLRRR